MYDLHIHILPGVDDGPETLEDALDMARIAAEQGVEVLVATPHRRDVSRGSSVRHLQDLLDDVNTQVHDQGIELTLLLGMENDLDLELPDDVSSGRALPINRSRYILVEMPFFGIPNYAEDVLFRLQLQGLTPVLVHPERAEAFQRDPDLLARFVERGMLTHITTASLLGQFGGRVQRSARHFLRKGLAHIICSDAHSPEGLRASALRDGMDAAAQIVGQESAYRMVVDTPKAVLENAPVDIEPSTLTGQPGRSWRFWDRSRRRKPPAS